MIVWEYFHNAIDYSVISASAPPSDAASAGICYQRTAGFIIEYRYAAICSIQWCVFYVVDIPFDHYANRQTVPCGLVITQFLAG